MSSKLPLQIIVLLIVTIHARGVYSGSDEASERISDMVNRLRSMSNISKLEMTISRPSWQRTIGMKIWDDRNNDRLFIRINEPAKDDGVAFLRVDDNFWNYLPTVEKVIKLPPSMMLQPWMGSDFTNDDLVKESSYVSDYDHQIIAREKADGENIIKIELTPREQAPVVWGKIIFWLRERDNLPVKQHFISDSGKLVKELAFTSFQVMDGQMIPKKWIMTPKLEEGRHTVMEIREIDFSPKPPIPEEIFTKQHLQKN